jgi:predicted nucleotidyltransferase
MNSSEALETLRRSEPDLRAPGAHLTVFDYASLKDHIAGLFDGPVDVVNRDGLKPYVRSAATADAIYAF